MDPGTAAKPDAPRIEVEPLELDLGTVPGDVITKSEVAVRNVGRSVLKIKEPRSGCGCTKVYLDDSELAPGAETRLRIEFDPSRLGNVFSATKTVMLSSNDPFLPSLTVTVRAAIDPEFSFDPKTFDFGEVAAGTPAERTVRIRQRGDEPLAITSMKVWPQKGPVAFSYEQLPEEEWNVPGRREYQITAFLTPEAPPGPIPQQRRGRAPPEAQTRP